LLDNDDDNNDDVVVEEEEILIFDSRCNRFCCYYSPLPFSFFFGFSAPFFSRDSLTTVASRVTELRKFHMECFFTWNEPKHKTLNYKRILFSFFVLSLSHNLQSYRFR